MTMNRRKLPNAEQIVRLGGAAILATCAPPLIPVPDAGLDLVEPLCNSWSCRTSSQEAYIRRRSGGVVSLTTGGLQQ